MNGQGQACDHQGLGGEVLGLVRDGKPVGDDPRHGRQHASQRNMADDGDEDQLVVGIAGSLWIALAQALAHHDGHRVAHGEHDDAEQIPCSGGNIQRGQRSHTAGGVALVDEGHAQRPEHLVEHQRGAGDGDLLQQVHGHMPAAVSAIKEGIAVLMSMSVDQHEEHLHETSDHRCQRCAAHAHSCAPHREGQSEHRHLPHGEDQQEVQHQVGENRNDRSHHRGHGLAHLAHGARIHLHQHEGAQTEEHDMQIIEGL